MLDPNGPQTRPEGGKPGQGRGNKINNEVRQGDNNKPSHNNEIQNMDMKAASAPQYQPMIPTTYRTEGEVDFKTKTELGYQTKTELEGQTKTDEGMTYIENKPIQNMPDDNRNHYIHPRIEYEMDNSRQTKSNVELELQTNKVVNTQDNINPTPHQANQMVASPMQDPFNFIEHQHRGNARGGLNKLPNDNTIHNFEGIHTNFTMERHPGTYGDGLRGQLGTPQRYFGPNRQQPGGSMEVNLMGHHNPLVLANL